MRSIGAIRKRKLLKIIQDEIDLQKAELFYSEFNGINYPSLKVAIENRIPEDWYDTWESAWAEIERLTSDALSNYAYQRELKF